MLTINDRDGNCPQEASVPSGGISSADLRSAGQQVADAVKLVVTMEMDDNSTTAAARLADFDTGTQRHPQFLF